MTARDQLLATLAKLDQRYTELEQQLAQHAAQADPPEYHARSKELQGLQDLVMTYRTIMRIDREVAEAEQLVHVQGDPELRDMAKEEAVSLRRQQVELMAQVERLWAERAGQGAVDNRPIIVELRAATGGLESSLFVGDLYRMYSRYAARVGLTVELLDSQPSDAGGFKELVFAVKGPAGAYAQFKFESGVHRVQRVPDTEAQGRIHTSTVTVAVMPEPQDVELPPIPAKDLQIDVYRSSGAGGQSVNTTDSAVRIRHLPSGIVVQCQDERSQLRNKERAMRVLRARLLEHLQQTQQAQLASQRRSQVKGGERSEKVRTYNYPDQRITDHRIGLTVHRFDAVMNGELDELIAALSAAERERPTPHGGGSAGVQQGTGRAPDAPA